AKLAFGSCVSTVAGKNPTVQLTGNRVGLNLLGTEAPFPDGNVANCTFTINAAATGTAALTFVRAGMSYAVFSDYNATGTNGLVTIGGGAGPTNTPVASTPTVAPATSTATAVAPTATQVPPT